MISKLTRLRLLAVLCGPLLGVVRYFAVCTLMEINVNPHYPGVRLFQEHESAYVAGWKTWAQGQPAPAGL